MTGASDSPVADRQAVFEDLYDALAELRSGAHLGAMAQRLLREGGLVALVEGGERAVFYRPESLSIVVCGFDVGGVEAGETLWRRAGDPAAWVDANRERVDWVHPRFRWVLELDGEQSAWVVVGCRERATGVECKVDSKLMCHQYVLPKSKYYEYQPITHE